MARILSVAPVAGRRGASGPYPDRVPMRVLWLSHFLPYPATGHGALQRSHHLLREAARRYEVHLISLAPPEQEAGHLLEEARAALGAMTASVTLVPVRPDPRGVRRMLAAGRSAVSARSFWHRWFWEPAMADAVRLRLAATPCDLVHLDTVLLARYAPLAAGVPLVLNHHNLESHLLRRRAEAHRRRAGKIFFGREADKVERWERSLAAQAAVNLMVSDLDGERLRELVPDARTATVANGVDVEFFGALRDVAVRPRSMVFAGGMDWFPNRDAMEHFATDVWPLLAADAPDRTLTVIGRSPPPALVAAAAADARVRALGFVDDVRPHVAASAAYVCPIRVGGGTRLKILDALAMRRPLVSTDIGVEGLGLEPERHYLPANAPAEFVAQLGRLDADPALGARLAAAGRRFVEEHFAWERVGDELARAYESATARARAPAPRPPRAVPSPTRAADRA